jgi:diacylglycerol kinase (ATP)
MFDEMRYDPAACRRCLEKQMKKLLQSLVDGERVLRALSYSLNGLRAAYKKESAFRQELILALLLVPLGLWLGRTGVERTLLIGSVLLVLIIELLNSAVETTVDRGGKDWDKLAGRAKDMGSAAVLIALLLVVLTWGSILWDRYGG